VVDKTGNPVRGGGGHGGRHSTRIVLVTHSSKKAIEDHFDVNYELEAELERAWQERAAGNSARLPRRLA